MKKDEIEKELIEDLKLGRGFYTELEHLMMSLMHTNERFVKVSNDFFQRYDITETQFNALMALADHYNFHGQPLNQKDLADRLLINKASAGTLIDRLQKNNWVKVKPSEEDRRAKNVFITPAGIQKYKEVFEPYYIFMGPLVDGISVADFEASLRTFRALRKNLKSLEADLSNDQ